MRQQIEGRLPVDLEREAFLHDVSPAANRNAGQGLVDTDGVAGVSNDGRIRGRVFYPCPVSSS